MNNRKTFAAEMLSYQSVYHLPDLFTDFLDLCLCVLSPGALAGFTFNRVSFDTLIRRYMDPALPFCFTSALSLLLNEIRVYQCLPRAYNDVLSNFYEHHIFAHTHGGQQLQTGLIEIEAEKHIRLRMITSPGTGHAQRIHLLDEQCGSGRRLLANRWRHNVESFYGVTSCPVNARIAILNLFLNRIPSAEVLFTSDDTGILEYQYGYSFTRQSAGIFEIADKRKSAGWALIGSSEEAYTT